MVETEDLIPIGVHCRPDQKPAMKIIAKRENQKLIGLYVQAFDLLIEKYKGE